MLLKQMIQAGVAIAWESRFDILGTVFGAVSKKYIRPHIPHPSSPFITIRAYRKIKPVWKRAIHAPSEELTPLPTITEPITTRYVIQRHHAKRAGEHFDLRLMIKGRGISFAIPKHRMPGKNENLLAVLQPDHIEEYFDFEGIIPDGNKGAGLVEIFASGEADVLSCDSGKLVFEIPDGPVSGRYVIIATGNGPRADSCIIRSFPPVVTQAEKPHVRLFGGKEDTYESKAIKAYNDGMVMEEKVDGACAGWQIDKDGRVELTSPRLSVKDNTVIRYTHKLPKLRADLAKSGLKNQSGEGELWHKRGPNFVAAVLNSAPERARFLQRKHGPVRLKLFNIHEDKAYAERYAHLKEVAKKSGSTVSVVSQYTPESNQTAIAFAAWCRLNSKCPRDGFVAKDPNGLGTDWWKGKPTNPDDVQIIGFQKGTGKYSDSLGALIVSREGREIKIGTGFTDFQRDWIWRNRESLQGECVKVQFHERANTTLLDTGGRFDGFHESKSDIGLRMYAEALADGTDRSPEDVKYALISAAGWRK